MMALHAPINVYFKLHVFEIQQYYVLVTFLQFGISHAIGANHGLCMACIYSERNQVYSAQ